MLQAERPLTPDEHIEPEGKEAFHTGHCQRPVQITAESYDPVAIKRIQAAWRRYSAAKAEFARRVFEEEEQARRERSSSSFRNLEFLDQLERRREEEDRKAIERNRRYALIYAATKIQGAYRERLSSVIQAAMRIQRTRRGQKEAHA